MIDQDRPLDHLLRLLRSGRAYDYPSLKAELGCSERHVRRLFETLEEAGIPVAHRTEDRRRKFYVPEEHLPKVPSSLALSEEEIYALLVASRAAGPALETTPLKAPLKTAARKLIDAYGEEIYTFEPKDEEAHWHFDAPAHNVIDEAIFRVVRTAIRDHVALEIDYTNLRGETSTARRIDPYVIALRGTSWLLVAHCHRHGSLLNFSLSAIERADLTNEHFDRPADFDPELHFRDAFAAMVGGEVHVVRLEVEADKAPAFRRKSYHPTQQIERELPDGGLVVSYEVAGLDEIAAFIRSWGPGVVVTEPPELADRLAREARTVATCYGPQEAAAGA